MKKKLLLLFLSCTLLAGCGAVPADSNPQTSSEDTKQSNSAQDEMYPDSKNQETPPRDDTTVSIATSVTPKTLVTLTNAYERAAYFADQTYQTNPGNTLVSPLSLDMALGLAAEGAFGTTAEELYAYLGGEDFTEKASEYITYVQSLTRQDNLDDTSSINMFEPTYTFQFQIANSVWVNERRQLSEEYANQVRTAYQAEVDSVDFENDTEATAKRINNWCKEKTNGLIPEILLPRQLSLDLVTILVNSVYFESPWVDKWGKVNGDFTDLSGKTTTQEMLVDSLSTYFENDQATAFAKSYYNGFEFIGILPKAGGEFQLSDLDLETLLSSRTNAYDVNAKMPKLNFDCTSDQIIPILQAQGVLRAFDRKAAEFDCIVPQNTDEVTYISDILQKCKLELDENGTRAAAVTAILMESESCMIDERIVKEVYLDRPFAFLIYDRTNDKILFAGKVINL